MKKMLFMIITALLFLQADAQKMKLGLLVYGGGGDWYANPTALKNLAFFCNQQLGTVFDSKEAQVEVGSKEIFNCPILFATGHGRIMFNDVEAQNLRTYLIGGGFLHVDDNYGLDKFIRPAMKKVFPELDFVELPFSHPIYHQKFDFANGLPKIHEHDGKAPKGYALVYQGRVVVFYSVETDLNDGWEDQEVHGDKEEKRQQALRMGANIVSYVFTN
ncbi:MAG: DUF4159 domain-containing protein [Chitinophagaceae bacterium]|nr:DUF4159 domain-containing protein [Chitinophagaceae bacterium]